MSVALIGSSGGGAATLGHTEPSHLLQAVNSELARVGDGDNTLMCALFVSLHGGIGLDVASPEKNQATLYSIDNDDDAQSDSHPHCIVRAVCTATLSEVNDTCRKMDEKIAKAILAGKVKGLICISCHVGIHSSTLKAAAAMNIPVTGTGGTSLSEAASKFGVHLVGNAGGSVATTSFTRAVSFAHALATAWKVPYRPFTTSNQLKTTPQWRSVLNACLPAFWAVCLTSRFLITLLESNVAYPKEWTDTARRLLIALQGYALPTTCCVILASSCARQHGSTAVMASCIAAMACQQSILSGMVAGWLVSLTLSWVLYRCILLNVPATMTNLVAAGGVGATVAIVMSPLVPLLQQITEWIRLGVQTTMSGSIPGVGFLIGCLFCYGSKLGYYHALCLPVILIEMELGDASIWGAIDECTLVLVSAGICTANLLVSTSDTTETALCRRAVRINLLYGDFIEAAYPFMERHSMVNIAGYLASGISTELLATNPKEVASLAYLPLPISIWLANDWRRMALACFTAYSVSFGGTALNNMIFTRKHKV